MGERTIGSTSPDPMQHGQVVKGDFNERTATFTTPVFGLCSSAPVAACRQSTRSGGAKLRIKDKINDTRDRFSWTWSKGAATAKADFGDPLTTTGYQLCAYDPASKLLNTAAPAGGICAGKTCWREQRKGFRYRDADQVGGLALLKLKEGANGKAKISVRGKGGNLSLPDLPLTRLPVTIQLVTTEGECWEAAYSGLLRNSDGRVLGRSD
jgi:hypothetical protein